VRIAASGRRAGLLAGLPETAVTGFLAFGAVALLYLATEELLVEADEADKTTGAAFFAGFVLVLVIETLL
jgi:ZIP family zinc transporter